MGQVLILGGDGFCGWPTALHLSDIGHQVCIVDNLSRRNIDNELEITSLTPIKPMGERIRAWHDVSGRQLNFFSFNIAKHYHRLLVLIEEFQPDAVIHFAEQRAAPYSMKSSWYCIKLLGIPRKRLGIWISSIYIIIAFRKFPFEEKAATAVKPSIIKPK